MEMEENSDDSTEVAPEKKAADVRNGKKIVQSSKRRSLFNNITNNDNNNDGVANNDGGNKANNKQKNEPPKENVKQPIGMEAHVLNCLANNIKPCSVDIREKEFEAMVMEIRESQHNHKLIVTALIGRLGEEFTLQTKWAHSKDIVQPQKAQKNFWLKETPIYVANAKLKPTVRRDLFPKRFRGKFCYLCGLHSGNSMQKCSFAGCSTRFHLGCAKKSQLGGFTFAFMERHGANEGSIFCSRHHCTACFADHNRSRCFQGSLITCDQCELAWHRNCIPGGCTINSNEEITCPRHCSFIDSPCLHMQHCAYCQQSLSEESSIKCTKCFRSAHFKCYRESKAAKTSSNPIDEEEERRSATCHWCDMFDFVRYDEYAMARFSRQWWYPCRVVDFEKFPERNNPMLVAVGYLCVEWLPYKGKTFYNLISHNRVIAMSDRDYFFVNEAKKSDIFEEWQLAQKYMVQNSPLNRPLSIDQIPASDMSNGERMVKKITRNRYYSPDLKTNKERLNEKDLCSCDIAAKDRCGPTSNCINRTIRLECPKNCGEHPNKGCNNRRISEGQNCIRVQIKYIPGKGYGAIALENVPAGGFVGEYVGEVISAAMRVERIERIASQESLEAQYYIMELDDRRAIDAQYYGNDMRYVNHSCSPNCMIQQIQSDSEVHLVLIAKQNIRAGDELSFDYNMKSSGSRSVPACRCGAPNCTGVLSADKVIKQAMYDWEGHKRKARRAQSQPAAKVAAKKGAEKEATTANNNKDNHRSKRRRTDADTTTRLGSPFSSSNPAKRRPAAAADDDADDAGPNANAAGGGQKCAMRRRSVKTAKKATEH